MKIDFKNLNKQNDVLFLTKLEPNTWYIYLVLLSRTNVHLAGSGRHVLVVLWASERDNCLPGHIATRDKTEGISQKTRCGQNIKLATGSEC